MAWGGWREGSGGDGGEEAMNRTYCMDFQYKPLKKKEIVKEPFNQYKENLLDSQNLWSTDRIFNYILLHEDRFLQLFSSSAQVVVS